VERVSKVLPHEHFTVATTYSGWMSARMAISVLLLDARDAVSLLSPESAYAQIEVGLMRDGTRVHGTSELRIDAARLGDSLEVP
jgi:hypothetical protein